MQRPRDSGRLNGHSEEEMCLCKGLAVTPLRYRLRCAPFKCPLVHICCEPGPLKQKEKVRDERRAHLNVSHCLTVKRRSHQGPVFLS